MLKIPPHQENIHSALITKNISTYIPKTRLVTKHLLLKATFVSKIRALRISISWPFCRVTVLRCLQLYESLNSCSTLQSLHRTTSGHHSPEKESQVIHEFTSFLQLFLNYFLCSSLCTNCQHKN